VHSTKAKDFFLQLISKVNVLEVHILIQLSDSTVFDQNTSVTVMLGNTLILNLKQRKGTISFRKSYFIQFYRTV
jgi:hypothetical protein